MYSIGHTHAIILFSGFVYSDNLEHAVEGDLCLINRDRYQSKTCHGREQRAGNSNNRHQFADRKCIVKYLKRTIRNQSQHNDDTCHTRKHPDTNLRFPQIENLSLKNCIEQLVDLLENGLPVEVLDRRNAIDRADKVAFRHGITCHNLTLLSDNGRIVSVYHPEKYGHTQKGDQSDLPRVDGKKDKRHDDHQHVDNRIASQRTYNRLYASRIVQPGYHITDFPHIEEYFG